MVPLLTPIPLKAWRKKGRTAKGKTRKPPKCKEKEHAVRAKERTPSWCSVRGAVQTVNTITIPFWCRVVRAYHIVILNKVTDGR